MILRLLFISLLIGLASVSFAQDTDEALYRTDTMGNEKNLRIVGLPIAFFTPETNLGFGGGAQVFFPKLSNVYNSRASYVLMSAIYTLNKQLSVDLKPQIYFNKGNYFLDMAFLYQVFPNSFWGIGNNTPESNQEGYEMSSIKAKAAFLKRINSELNFGFQYVFQYHGVTSQQTEGLLAKGDILGNDGAVISGFGLVFNMDTRNNISSPTRGTFVELSSRTSGEIFGASSNFNTFVTDLRNYIPIKKDNLIFATQLYLENNFGDVPFQGLAWYGGGERARGYFRGRFMDKSMYSLQAELRWRFRPRLIAAVFGLIGEVGDVPLDLLKGIKPGAGGGIRFQVFKEQDILLRIDVGIGQDGSSGFYFGVNEAF